MVTMLVLFDFSKAFDTISPSKLIYKLRSLGFSRTVLMWIFDYLRGRSQRVISKSGDSGYLNTNLGVPQGSVLGPLLFSLYINDLHDLLSPLSIKHVLYADDLQIYLQVPLEEVEDGAARLSAVARLISEWAVRAQLRLNASKTQAMFLGTAAMVKRVKQLGLPGIEVGGGARIPFSDETKSLGVILDSALTWKPQINQVTKKVNRALYMLRFIRSCTTETLRRRLVESLVIPHLDYCTVVCLDASSELRVRLQRLSNACVRYIYGVRRDSRITPYRRQLGWLRLDSRRMYFAALIMYKILRMGQPKYLAALFTRRNPRRPERGEPKELEIPLMRTQMGFSSFQSQGARFWNSLPASVRHLPSLSRFKRAVKRFLFDQEA